MNERERGESPSLFLVNGSKVPDLPGRVTGDDAAALGKAPGHHGSGAHDNEDQRVT